MCNALELIDPTYRNQGFTTEPLQCIYPNLAPIVGYARTGTMRAVQGPRVSAEEQKEIRINWYKYVDEGPKPSIIILQDLDGARAGIGAFWGEVNTHVHRGLGAKGVVTNGSIRDIPMNASNFQLLAGSVMPSHAHVHIVGIGVPVTVAGMAVQPNDLIHADQHGAVVIPLAAAEKINAAVELIAKKEAVIISAAKASNFSWEILRDAIKESADIH
ncbi:MAG: RraA family protein [Burkholderiaceae bacterium]|nr:RraA family protein [Burkholderiaceae bacterium]